MPGIHTLVDTFDDNTVDTGLWPNNYGTYQESGGRARVACDTSFNGYKSATSYTLTGSHVLLQMYPPAAAGAGSATCSMFVVSSTAGTDAGFLIDSVFTVMGIYLRVGGGDASPVFITFSPTDHAWLRLRETGGTLYWETSPDASTWTVQRTAATPAWAADTDLALLLEAHRDTGTNNLAEYDNVNSPPGQTITLGTAAETDTATGPAASKRRSLTPGQASESARPPGLSKTRTLTPAAATSTAIAPTLAKRRTLTPATETATALPPSGAKQRALAPAGHTDTAVAATPIKSRTPGPAAETATALPLTAAKRRTLTPAAETDRAPAPALSNAITHNLRVAGTTRTAWTADTAATAWSARATATAWAITGRTPAVDALSTEYYEVPVTWDRGTPTSYGVEMAVLAVGHEPGTSDWHAAQWSTNSDGLTVARLLVGPDGGALAPTPGRYRAWVSVDATPEHPVLFTPPFDIE